MRKLILIAFVLLIAFVFVQTTAAQATKVKCDPAAVIAKANSLKSSKDAQKDMTVLLALTNDISAANIACNGLTFSGKGSKVLNPFDLPAGTYRMRWMKGGGGNVSLRGISDEYCSGIVSASIEESTVTAGETCRAVIKSLMLNKADEWVVTLEPLE